MNHHTEKRPTSLFILRTETCFFFVFLLRLWRNGAYQTIHFYQCDTRLAPVTLFMQFAWLILACLLSTPHPKTLQNKHWPSGIIEVSQFLIWVREGCTFIMGWNSNIVLKCLLWPFPSNLQSVCIYYISQFRLKEAWWAPMMNFPFKEGYLD